MNYEINAIQELNLKLIEKATFNEFNGIEIVNQLRLHRELWKAVLVDRLNSLIKLRDLPNNNWNVDTLYILSTGDVCKDNQLRTLLKKLNADNVGYCKDASELLGEHPTKNKVIFAWWD